MDKLPNELLIQIIGEVQDEADGREVNALTPLVCVNRLWKSVVEPFVWREVSLGFNELKKFRRYFAADTNRRESLKVLRLQLNNYFEYADDDNEDGHTSNDEEVETDGKDNEDSDEESLNSEELFEATIEEAKSDHCRLFLEVQKLWDELYSWDTALQVETLYLHIQGQSFYDFLGPEMRKDDAVYEHIINDGWLRRYAKPPTTMLLPVKSLTVEASKDVQIWPAIVGCTIAESLPNLEELKLFDSDQDKKWRLLRSELRDVLADRITNLSQKSLRTFRICLPFKYSMNQDVHPPNLLRNGIDTLSISLNGLLTNLVTLTIEVNHLSPVLFWDPNTKASSLMYPNLRSLHVDTGFETASGKYLMRNSLDFRRKHYLGDEDLGLLIPNPELGWPDPEVELDMELGDYPISICRVRPKIAYFNQLAISLAHAATHSPRLESITIEFVSHFTDRGRWTGYHGWGFAFRAGPKARNPESHNWNWCGRPGLDMWELDMPYREWTFRCGLGELEWDEPDEANLLWEQRFPGIESDIVCFDFDEDGKACWTGYHTDLAMYPEEMIDDGHRGPSTHP